MFKAIKVLILLGFLGIAVLFGVLWIEHNIGVTLPSPTGPLAVGRTTYDWIDRTANRELLAWIWYPAARSQSSQTTEDYLPDAWRTAIVHRNGVLFSQFLTRDLAKVRTHSVRGVPVAPESNSYPVVFMRAGLAAQTTTYTTLAEDLASYGYVVVGFDAPYRTTIVVLPDGKVVERAPENNADLLSGPEQEALANRLVQAWSAGTAFALDRLEQLNRQDPSGKFAGRLDLQHTGIFGHSLGGATALQFCHDDSRCKAGVDIDGAPLGSAVTQGVHQPFMFLLSDHKGESGEEKRQVMGNIRAIYDRLPADGRMELMIRGANHFGFSDDGALLKSHIIMGALRIAGVLGVDGRRQLAITTYCVHSFFDEHLKGMQASKPFIPSPLYPEIQIVQ